MSRGPIVVAVLSHRDPPQLQRLVDRILTGERTVVLLHHDPRAVPHGLRPDSRVLQVREPQPAGWGRPALARAMLRCLDDALVQVPDLDWLLLVSGQDYPTRALRQIESELDALDVDATLRHLTVGDPAFDTHPWQQRCRSRYLHRRRLPGSHRSVPCPRWPPFDESTRLYIGDMWVNLGIDAVRHVQAQRQRLARVERYLCRCSVPDEALLPSLLLNDSDGLRIADDSHRYLRWTEGEPHPATLTDADLPAIAASTAWFTRKVDPVVSATLLDQLDQLATTPHLRG